MKVAIIGSRSFNDYDLLQQVMSEFPTQIDCIISGGAHGADALAERYAIENNIPFREYKARWGDLNQEPCKIKVNKWGKKYNALAGHNRNTLIIEDCDAVVAFWDGSSNGTRDSLDKARSMGKRIKTVIFT